MERQPDLSVDDFQSAWPLKKIKEKEEFTVWKALIPDLILKQKGHQVATLLGIQLKKGLARAQNAIQSKMGKVF